MESVLEGIDLPGGRLQPFELLDTILHGEIQSGWRHLALPGPRQFVRRKRWCVGCFRSDRWNCQSGRISERDPASILKYVVSSLLRLLRWPKSSTAPPKVFREVPCRLNPTRWTGNLAIWLGCRYATFKMRPTCRNPLWPPFARGSTVTWGEMLDGLAGRANSMEVPN